MEKIQVGAPSEPDIFELWNAVWGAKWFVIAMTFVFTAAGVSYALLATQWWRADTVLVRVGEKDLPSSLGQFGSLASLAGIDLNGAGNDQTPVAVLKSRELVAEFITGHNLLPVLFAEKWDATAHRWKSTDPKKQPDIRDGVRLFEKSVRAVSEDKKSGVLTLSIVWKDPDLAAQWANDLVSQVNRKLRERALTESERNIKYLRGEIAETAVASLQQSMGRVLESEMQKMLMARGRDEYAFRVIDHASPPKQREKPQRALITAFSMMAGGGLAVFIVLLRRARRTSFAGTGV